MPKREKNPSKAGVSAASVKGNAGPKYAQTGGKTQTTNQQYGAENTQDNE
ncbi:YuzL family protein [Ferdinandcohnia quinoae]|uniref:YuzL family protein n=1 Tax=Fredinandcohnia quinoae TaxID=2918902 RepID=A0AAW5E6I2_9BACI|nr:YuzL family protein [Fredinandcohnia sp. SECRCQ15]MCH1625581.1 YuzL family protein [Fredinandcohnia sp. SECRCQ15]